ncbi:response regulator transcription factor [uncultured Cocleimonas sp.]|uniref:response regulator transcription factor n=1 Tax=uncultured Cocleimonas sp. TaxID=1051587 RepID=UPI002615917E|nr:response regulator transcription factor [uncultured Cocleimonas sp.]
MSSLNDFHGRILVVEDNTDIASLLVDFFTDKGHIADYASDGLTGLHLVTVNEYDVILLDLALPGIDGITLCQKLRKELHSSTPILMLTARDSLDEKLIGFDAGADDYLVKPFDLLEVYARVQALWRRSNNDNQTIINVSNLAFNYETLEVAREGNAIKLNSIRLKILRLLMENTHRVVSRREMETHVWGDDPTESDALRTHLSAIRQAIDKPYENKLLHTIHSVGYRLYDDQAA